MRAFFAIGAAAIAVAMPLPTMAATASKTGHFAGYWQSSCWGNVMLYQKGTKVTGSFSLHGGKIVGTVRGAKLTGKWSQSSKGGESGTFVVTLSTNGKKFQGHWTYKGKQQSKPIKAARIE